MTIDPSDLARLKELCEKATPGPWDVGAGPSKIPGGPREWCVFMPECEDSSYLTEANADFIAAARTWLPKLVAEVERLRRVQSAALNYVEACSEGLPKEARDNYLDTFLDAIHAEPGGESQ